MHNGNESSPLLINVLFSGNASERTGGGMMNSAASSPTMTNSKKMMQAACNQAAWFHFEIADAVIGTAYAYSEFSFISLTFEMTGHIL